MTVLHAQRLRELLGKSKVLPSDAELPCDSYPSMPRQIGEILVSRDLGASPGEPCPTCLEAYLPVRSAAFRPFIRPRNEVTNVRSQFFPTCLVDTFFLETGEAVIRRRGASVRAKHIGVILAEGLL